MRLPSLPAAWRRIIHAPLPVQVHPPAPTDVRYRWPDEPLGPLLSAFPRPPIRAAPKPPPVPRKPRRAPVQRNPRLSVVVEDCPKIPPRMPGSSLPRAYSPS